MSRAVVQLPRLRSLNAVPHNLPVQLTSFVGREAELSEVESLVRSSRELTLTGAGGVGKTRLAIQAAADLMDEFADGAWLVELAPLTHDTLVGPTVARALGAGRVKRDPTDPALLEYLSGRDLLLVLDNCEHLVQACAELTARILRTCPRVRVLATSRELLGVPGEVAWRVLPLGVPADPMLSCRDLAGYEAVRLFVERARQTIPGFALDERTAPSVGQICRSLDGLPLGIELAAARMRMLPVQEIARRLDDRFRLLNAGSRTAPRRQQTLRDMVDWSYDLLPEPERKLLRRLAVFAGGWSLGAAEAVCADGVALRSDQILETLAALVDKSLVVAAEADGQARYGALETIRVYAAERLERAHEEAEVRARHAAWCLELARSSDARIDGPDRPAMVERLEGEHDNIRAALGWSAENGDAADHATLVVALANFWFIQAHLAEGIYWHEKALARPGSDTATRAALMHGLGVLTRALGCYDAAEALFGGALELAESVGDTGRTAAVLHALGRALMRRGDYPRSLALFERSLRIYRASGDDCHAIETLGSLAELARLRGEPAESVRMAEASLAAARRLAFPWLVAAELRTLGAALESAGKLDRAEEVLEEAATVGSWGPSNRRAVLDGRFHQILIALRRGDSARARPLLREALTETRRNGSTRDAAQQLEAAGWLALVDRRPERAARLLGAGDACRRAIRLVIPPVERVGRQRLVSTVRGELGRAAFASAWRVGEEMRLDDALVFALTDTEPVRRASANSNPSPLTPRELEVAALIARGYSNRRIAEALVIAQGTAQRHVANVLAKLDVSSRASIAAWAVEQGLVSVG